MTKEKEKEMNFEESLEKLNEIVKKLENGDILLDDAIKNFNEAMNLVKNCDKKLKEAEEAISKIVDEDGNLNDFKINE